MGRSRNPNRDGARKRWLESGGKISTKELAEKAGVPESRIRKWKCEDKWQEELEKKKPGAQPGNKNASGHGAPAHNTNAETHGAYSTVYLESLLPEDRAYIEGITLDTQANMLRELRLLMAKEGDLKRRINKLTQESPDVLFVDKVIEMLVPKDGEGNENTQGAELFKTSMRTVIKASPFERAMKLEVELNKTHGRIIKLIDIIKAHEFDTQRLELEQQKYRLAKQKATGQYDIDPETGEIKDGEPSGNEDCEPEI